MIKNFKDLCQEPMINKLAFFYLKYKSSIFKSYKCSRPYRFIKFNKRGQEIYCNSYLFDNIRKFVYNPYNYHTHSNEFDLIVQLINKICKNEKKFIEIYNKFDMSSAINQIKIEHQRVEDDYLKIKVIRDFNSNLYDIFSVKNIYEFISIFIDAQIRLKYITVIDPHSGSLVFDHDDENLDPKIKFFKRTEQFLNDYYDEEENKFDIALTFQQFKKYLRIKEFVLEDLFTQLGCDDLITPEELQKVMLLKTIEHASTYQDLYESGFGLIRMKIIAMMLDKQLALFGMLDDNIIVREIAIFLIKDQGFTT